MKHDMENLIILVIQCSILVYDKHTGLTNFVLIDFRNAVWVSVNQYVEKCISVGCR